MSVSYQYDKVSNFVFSDAEGTLDSHEIIEHLTNLLNDENISSSFINIVSVENMVDLLFRYSDAEIISGVLKDLNSKGLKFTIFIANNADKRNMVEVIFSFFKSESDSEIAQAFIVDNKEKALELAYTTIKSDGVDLF